jgi:hypothetical protein
LGTSAAEAYFGRPPKEQTPTAPNVRMWYASNSIGNIQQANAPVSGIFGYINYLVEKDRKFILDTLVNGQPPFLLGPYFIQDEHTLTLSC